MNAASKLLSIAVLSLVAPACMAIDNPDCVDGICDDDVFGDEGADSRGSGEGGDDGADTGHEGGDDGLGVRTPDDGGCEGGLEVRPPCTGDACDDDDDDDGGECDGVDDGEPNGCTLTQGYWENHQPWPAAAETEFCGRTGLELLEMPTEGDAWMILVHQLIAAELNVASGASTTCEIDVAMFEARELLGACEVSEVERADAIALADLLDRYNNGEVGPGHCDG